MSSEAAKAAIERMKSDTAFHDSVMSMDSVDERIGRIRAEGFECTAAEIEAHGHPLADAEMKDASGGRCEFEEGAGCACATGAAGEGVC